MTVSDKRYRDYKRARRTGLNARAAWFATSKPRYDVDPYDDDQSVSVGGEVFRVRVVPDPDAWSLLREDVELGFCTEDDASHLSYYLVMVDHASGVSASLGGVGDDDRHPFGRRYIIEEVCDVIDEVRAMLPRAARALLPYQAGAR